MTILTYHLQTKGKERKEVYAIMSNKQCGLQDMHAHLNLLKGLNEDRVQSIYCNFISSTTIGHFEVVLE